MIALSYSRLSDFRQCPRKFMLKYIEKAANFKEDASKSPHLVRGGNVHKSLENYVIKLRSKEEGIRVSTLVEVEQTKPLVNQLFSMYDLHPELQVAVNDKFEVVDWFSKDAWFRVIYDLIGFGTNLFIGDYKTGKFADYMGTFDKPGQLHLSSLIGMAVWPNYEEIDNRYIYVDHKKTVPLKLSRTQHYELLKDKLIAEHNLVNAEDDWDPKKNEHCQWCQATRDQCEFSKKQVLPGQTESAPVLPGR